MIFRGTSLKWPWRSLITFRMAQIILACSKAQLKLLTITRRPQSSWVSFGGSSSICACPLKIQNCSQNVCNSLRTSDIYSAWHRHLASVSPEQRIAHGKSPHQSRVFERTSCSKPSRELLLSLVSFQLLTLIYWERLNFLKTSSFSFPWKGKVKKNVLSLN